MDRKAVGKIVPKVRKPRGPKPFDGPPVCGLVCAEITKRNPTMRVEQRSGGNWAVYTPSGALAAFLFSSKKTPQVFLRSFRSVGNSSIPQTNFNAILQMKVGNGVKLTIPGGTVADYAKVVLAHAGDVEKEWELRHGLQ